MKKVVVLFIFMVMMVGVYGWTYTTNESETGIKDYQVTIDDRVTEYTHFQNIQTLDITFKGVKYTRVGNYGTQFTQPVFSNSQDGELFTPQYEQSTDRWSMVQVYDSSDDSSGTYSQCTSSSQPTCGTGSYTSTLIKNQDDIRDMSRSMAVSSTFNNKSVLS